MKKFPKKVPTDSFNKTNYFRESQDSRFNMYKTSYKPPKISNFLSKIPKLKSTIDLRTGFNYKLKLSKLDFSSMTESKPEEVMDPHVLKNDLLRYRTEYFNMNKELTELKIKYGKLNEENNNNKEILRKILRISPYTNISKGFVMQKIKNCHLSEDNRKMLEYSYQILVTKLEIAEKSKIFNLKKNFLDEIIKNSKAKTLTELLNQHYTMCRQERSLSNTLQKLEQNYEHYEKKIEEISSYMDDEKMSNVELNIKDEESFTLFHNKMEEKNNLVKEINKLVEKMKKQEKLFITKEREKKDLERRINISEEKLDILNEYIYIRDGKLKELEEKKKRKEQNQKSLSEQENQIRILNREFDQMQNKAIAYRNERPKLIQKAKEPKKEIERMINLKNELEKLYQTKAETEKKHKETQLKLNTIKEEEKKKNELNCEIIQKNNSIIDGLNNKKNELKNKIEEINLICREIEEDLKKCKIDFENLEKGEEELKKNIQENELQDEENQNKLNEDMKIQQSKNEKKYKKDLDKLNLQLNTLTNEKNSLEQENKNFKNDNDIMDKDLQDFDSIEEQIKQAKIKLDELNGKK